MNPKFDNSQPFNKAGLFMLTFRLVIGWTYFSAFWRRLIIDNKLIPDEAGYIGEKFNHFLPNALGIKPLIEYLVTNPESLHIAMIAFTIVEAIVGLFIMFGFMTRLMAMGVFSLAMGILLGSGWLGTTCLDEWQIGVLGIAGGFTMFLSGSGSYSVDQFLMSKNLTFTRRRWFRWLGSGDLPVVNLKGLVLTGSFLIFGLTLYTNQYFHGGVFGTLHNKSVKPKLELSNLKLDEERLQFEVYRTEGADVYGSFLIGIQLIDKAGSVVLELDQVDLANFKTSQIANHFVAEIKPGKQSLAIPLGAKADLTVSTDGFSLIRNSNYTLRLVDISGLEWSAQVSY